MTSLPCVLFDLDNTLTDRDASLHVFSHHFMADFCNDLHPQTLYETVCDVVKKGDGGGYRPKDEMFHEILSELSWQTRPTPELIADYWYSQSPLCMQARPGVLATLQALAAQGYTMGIISNGQTTVQNATLDALNIRPLMQTVIVSETVGLRKPDPAIFLLALSHLNAAPGNTFYIGDHPISDVVGARQAGLHAVWLSRVHVWPSDVPKPDYEITEISQILDILRERI